MSCGVAILLMTSFGVVPPSGTSHLLVCETTCVGSGAVSVLDHNFGLLFLGDTCTAALSVRTCTKTILVEVTNVVMSNGVHVTGSSCSHGLAIAGKAVNPPTIKLTFLAEPSFHVHMMLSTCWAPSCGEEHAVQPPIWRDLHVTTDPNNWLFVAGSCKWIEHEIVDIGRVMRDC